MHAYSGSFAVFARTIPRGDGAKSGHGPQTAPAA